ncbi:MAG: hypothetical protein GX050_05300 [Firmicutes bacterium]|nr:hypothetical protein [Bacillota bacterium]
MRIIILNREKALFVLYLLGILLCLPVLLPYLTQPLFTEGRLNRTPMIIDPGHGGIDGGTKDHHGNLEKKINLEIALKLRDQLRQSGLPVLMTRETDTELFPYIAGRRGRHRRDLQTRIEKAKAANCQFLVSIHCDWSTDRTRRGMVAFYNHRNQASKNLALAIQDELNKLQTKPQKAAPGKYFILEQPGVTGVLVEVGFLSHPEEAALLQNPEYQETISFGISKGILRYFRDYYR